MSSTRQPYVDNDLECIGSAASGFARTTAKRLEALVSTGLEGIVEEARVVAERGVWVTFVAREPCCGAGVYLNVRARRALSETTNADVLALAQRVRGLEIPAVLPVHRFGVTDELLWVTTLAHRGRLLDQPTPEGPAERASRALAFLRQVAGPVSVMHRAGVAHGGLFAGSFHRDVEGRVRVRNVQFEVPILRSCLAAGIQTEAVACAAPEVREGARPEPASDQYTIAALVALIAGGTPPTLAGDLTGEDIPAAMRGPLRRALSRRPEHRFQGVLDLWDALAPLAANPSGAGAEPSARGLTRVVEGSGIQPASSTGGFDGARFGRRRRRDRTVGTEDVEPTRVGTSPSGGWWARTLAAAAVFLLFSGGVEVLIDRDGTPRAPESESPAAVTTTEAPAAADPPETETRTDLVADATAASERGAARAPDSTTTTASAPGGSESAPREVPARATRPVEPSTAVPARAAPTSPGATPTSVASAAPGRISLQTYPWGAAYVDGRYVGDTPLVDVRVASGDHTVRVERSGHEPYERDVHVRPGETLRLTGIVLRASGW